MWGQVLQSIYTMGRQLMFNFHFVVHISQCIICFCDLYGSGEYFDCGEKLDFYFWIALVVSDPNLQEMLRRKVIGT